MVTTPELVDAAATILVVAAAHLRQTFTSRRRHDALADKLDRNSRQLADCEKRLARWSGLP